MTKRFERSLDIKNGRVDMTHGSGGRAMAQLIEQMFAKAFDNPALAEGNDQARLTLPMVNGKAPRLAFSTDSYVISPLFFPGGNIGSLAVHGTVNDVAMAGAKPLWLSAGFILEEGFPLADLADIIETMASAAKECGVQIVTGDTKVVEKGKADGVFINTAGVGVFDESLDLSTHNIKVGDAILVSGTLGDHGVAVMAEREKLVFDEPVLTDSAPLNGLIEAMVKSGVELHALRDPTRGGLATTLNEMAQSASVGMRLEEAAIPVRPSVRGVCEILGLDPLYIANEGKLIAFCPAAQAEKLLAVMRLHREGRNAAIIGTVVEDENNFVEMKTSFGGNRMVDWLAGEQLPRIC
ncbi:MAG TPA: hydrogenase expression/formation protein HypE [Rhodospirillaceae bacterium]|nr:hydrogenase expression/formation protein HypE [Rhodospirillaceae bacterium]